MKTQLRITYSIFCAVLTVIGLGGVNDDLSVWQKWLGGVPNSSMAWGIAAIVGGIIGTALTWLIPWGRPKRKRAATKGDAPTPGGVVAKSRNWLRRWPAVWVPPLVFAASVAVAVTLNGVSKSKRGELAVAPPAGDNQPPAATSSATRPVEELVAPPFRKALPSAVTLDEILKELMDAPEPEKQAIREKYTGVEVTWTCSFDGAERVGDEQMNLTMNYSYFLSSRGTNTSRTTSGATSIVASVLSWEYPGIEQLTAGTSIQINGLIDEVFDTGGFRLRGARLWFEP
jgi:hypothetical protein